jgi:hypothetical protein
MVSFLKKLSLAIIKVIFLPQGRKGWQYDLLAVMILLTVVLFPYGRSLNGIEPEGMGVTAIDLKVEGKKFPLQLLKLSGTKVVKRIEPIISGDGKISGYKVLFNEEEKKSEKD